MLTFQAVGLISVLWPRVGSGLFVAAAFGGWWFFRGARLLTVLPLILLPLIALGAMFWWGRMPKRSISVALLIGVPWLICLSSGIGPAWRIAHRFDDGNRDLRLIEANGIKLLWAPAGPGWPDSGVSWTEAAERCRYLTPDGLHLATFPQNVWWLPTVEEVVRASCRHGVNAGGKWNPARLHADFSVTPDKESPLWNPHTPIIYWWTATETSRNRALRINYNGHVMALPTKTRYGYLGFRAVRDPEP